MVITQAQTRAQPQIQTVNIANAVAYVINCAVTYGTMLLPQFTDQATVSAKYQTLVTPAPYAFGIWGIIFTAELVWTVFQLLPSYRANVVVTHGVSYYFVVASIAQAVWIFFFSKEMMIPSLVAMLVILGSLFAIILNVTKLSCINIKDILLLKVPFQVHFAWILAATAINVSVVLVDQNKSADLQFYTACASLVVLAVVAFWGSFERIYAIPVVIAYASFWISFELQNPDKKLGDTFDQSRLDLIQRASGSLALVVLLTTIVAYAHAWYNNKDNDNEVNESSSTTTSGAKYTRLDDN